MRNEEIKWLNVGNPLFNFISPVLPFSRSTILLSLFPHSPIRRHFSLCAYVTLLLCTFATLCLCAFVPLLLCHSHLFLLMP